MHNSTYMQVEFQILKESEVLFHSYVILMKLSAKNPQL